MDDEDIIQDPLPDEPQLSPAGGDRTVETNPTPSDSMSLSEINKFLGKDFKDKDTALKSLKDTFAYVGKKKEDIAKEVLGNIDAKQETERLANQIKEMQKQLFYKDNPQYADESVRKIIEKMGDNPEQIVTLPEFKSIFDKVKGFDESQKLRTVLESNPRIASSRDNLDKARQLQQQGGSKEEVERLATQAVIDAFQK